MERKGASVLFDYVGPTDVAAEEPVKEEVATEGKTEKKSKKAEKDKE